MIRDEYKAQLLQVREEQETVTKKWGSSGARNFGYHLLNYLQRRKYITTVLDFGAGHGSLGRYIKEHLARSIDWTEYDPGMPDLQKIPEGQFDLITSSDVLEHLEPESVDETLAWMADHATRAQYHYISCSPSGRLLPDGRSVHLTVHPTDWWVEKFKRPGWEIQLYYSYKRRTRGAWVEACGIQTDKL